ncbi:MAG: HPF/RaiA family ribosome-associated protein [Proteobacteria bacterium]|nr:HPF/RaiA family ribosome-associated protein [Pseudomonadota bacterium]MBU1418689.1 HPF/RaiA family ribosome-associated protein [Pseudomonadota bacterium]MBU1454435.1 HPF/RaiA family ribosome-associated protein [Pseudomonadota bacterium]
MQVPLQITFRNMESSLAIEADIKKRVDKLNRHHTDIISCRVVVEAPLQHKQKGGLFNVCIDLTCPQGKLEINREPAAQHHAHEDLYVVLRDAFNAADRKLDEYKSRRKGEVKFHEDARHGRITYLAPMEDYGLITTADEREIYFHRNSILNADLDALEIGTQVHFHEEEGHKGPQASSVKVLE